MLVIARDCKGLCHPQMRMHESCRQATRHCSAILGQNLDSLEDPLSVLFIFFVNPL